MKKIYLFTVISLKILFASAQLYTPGGGVTDIDGNTYQTIVINGQEWMAENLKTSKYANGNEIPNVSTSAWPNLTTGAWCNFANDSLNDNIYGKLYNWYTVADQRKVCPTDWHVPSLTEWEDLSYFLGGPFNLDQSVYPFDPGNSISGGKMKSLGNIQDGSGLWESPNLNGTNESGFAAVPGGFRNDGSGGFFSKGQSAEFWSTTGMPGSTSIISYFLRYEYGYFLKHGNGKSTGLSIRCIKDNTSSINEINPENKSIIKIYDLMGNETTIKLNEILFYLYSNGSVEKKIIFE